MTTNTHATPLPTSRTLLTNLLNAISAIPLTPPPATLPNLPGNPNKQRRGEDQIKEQIREEKGKEDDDGGGNPLRRVPPSHRHLVATLHVLFPGLVLPALDLLERGLVAGVVCRPGLPLRGLTTPGGDDDAQQVGRDAGGNGGTGGGGRLRAKEEIKVENEKVDEEAAAAVGLDGDRLEKTADEAERLPPSGGGEADDGGFGGRKTAEGESRTKYAFYFVQSAAAAEAARERRRRRKRGDEDGGDSREGKGYIVRLDAWHCSCAAFAFAAVQGDSAASQGWQGTAGETGLGNDDWHVSPAADESHAEVGTEEEWSFGGMSLDGRGAGLNEEVPVCKHLLACVLAERWHTALGRYVVKRTVQKEEMAGIVAEI
ncbi:hypothetical protein C7999DRAFT_27698 [Corynascus novoguineensis]|uniref:SWIM-type domain-containing protein n=1 Tax=Corynascus novoguineensis TaxID=1126955 RepID=A0AAN7D096_9PEZI|nr:hypothetical protein C7999DRAFT_27698 [Corynascus novoguineensis]